MTQEAQTQTDDGTEEKDPKWYREQLAAKDEALADKEKEANKLRVKLLESTFKEVGIDPAKGLGKAIAADYDGEADAEALRNFAIEKWDWEPPTSENPIAGAVTEAQGRVSAAVKDATSAPTEQIDLDIAQAEERGDFASAMALKLNKFRQEQGI